MSGPNHWKKKKDILQFLQGFSDFSWRISHKNAVLNTFSSKRSTIKHLILFVFQLRVKAYGIQFAGKIFYAWGSNSINRT